MPVIPVLGEARQIDLCEFQASLVYKIKSRTTKATETLSLWQGGGEQHYLLSIYKLRLGPEWKKPMFCARLFGRLMFLIVSGELIREEFPR